MCYFASQKEVKALTQHIFCRDFWLFYGLVFHIIKIFYIIRIKKFLFYTTQRKSVSQYSENSLILLGAILMKRVISLARLRTFNIELHGGLQTFTARKVDGIQNVE